jgi:non-reducing end alpha-L-arabinofuranosidase
MHKATVLLAFSIVASGCKSSSESSGPSGGASSSAGTERGSAGAGGKSAGSSSSSSSGGTGGSGVSGSSSKAGASGGSAPGGQSGSGGTTASCSNEAPCGGEVLGTWNVTSSCLTVEGQLDLSSFLGANCPSPQVVGSLKVSGTWSAKSDGTFADKTTTSGNEQFSLATTCLSFSGTTLDCDQVSIPLQGVGYSAVSCKNAAGGGCSCSGTVEQPGGLGMLSTDPPTSGKFATSGNVITIDGSNAYAYCVSGSKMTWTPQTQNPKTTGSVVFTKSTGGATGGSSGSGGTTGSGGASSSGGTVSSGGSGASGGTSGSGKSTSGGSGGTSGSGGSTGAAGSTGAYQGPCDIYAASGTPCVAAYSPVRLLSSKYKGPLYQVRIGGSNSGSGGTLKDIGLIADGVFADGASQDTLCGSSACTIAKLYDQSGKGNDLVVAGPGCYVKTADTESSAKGKSLTVSGHKVYALYMQSDSSFGSSTGPTHDGYRNNNAVGLPTGTAAQGIYEIVDGKRANAGCCWNFGSAQRDSCSTGGTGAMNTISFGLKFVWGTGAGNGPWFMGDFEGGVWAGGSGVAATQNPNNPSVTWDYGFGIVKTDTANGTPQYAIRVGNAQSGGLTTAYDGKAPAVWNLQGGVVLGIGGDNSNTSYGTFFEGAITAGRPSDATDLAVLQNAQAAGYGK